MSDSQAYQPERWWVSEYNFDVEVQGLSTAGKPLSINDVTLREVEQGYSVVLKADDMVRLAEELVHVGVRRLEIWPILSPANRTVMKQITTYFPDIDVHSLTRPGFKGDFDVAFENGAKGAHVFTPSPNEFVAKHAMRQTPDEVIESLLKWGQYAKEQGKKSVLGLSGDVALRKVVVRSRGRQLAPTRLVGPGYSVALGLMAGNNLIRMRLAELDVAAREEDITRIRDPVKEEGRVRNGPVPKSALCNIVDRVELERRATT